MDISVNKYDLKKQANFTNFCKCNSIFLPLFDPDYVRNIPLRKVSFTSWILPQSTRVESRTSELAFASSSPLKTNHSDRHMLTVAPIIDLLIYLEACCHVTSPNVDCNCHCSYVVTYKLTIVTETDFRHISWYLLCKVLSSLNGCNSLWNCWQGNANELNLWRIECIINGR